MTRRGVYLIHDRIQIMATEFSFSSHEREYYRMAGGSFTTFLAFHRAGGMGDSESGAKAHEHRRMSGSIFSVDGFFFGSFCARTG